MGTTASAITAGTPPFRLKRIARAFLKKVLPKETIQRLDLKRLSMESRHLTDEMFKKRVADVVYRVPIKCGRQLKSAARGEEKCSAG